MNIVFPQNSGYFLVDGVPWCQQAKRCLDQSPQTRLWKAVETFGRDIPATVCIALINTFSKV
jgi:hypothetical protein